MKNIILLGSILMSLTVSSQKIGDYKQLEIKGGYTNPLFSPTGEYVLLTGEHMMGVFLLDIASMQVKQISDKAGSGYAYTWDTSGNSFYYKEKPEKGFYSESKVVNYNVRDQYSRLVNDIDHNYLPSYKGSKDQVVVYTNLTTLKIEAKNLSTSKHWTVTNDEGQFYNALLSNDGKKVAVHNGADIYIYSIDGSTPARKIGRGIATAWSEDDTYLIGFMDESEDGHNVTNSELYLFNAETGKTRKLTNTEVFSEMYPTVYKDRIIFSDDKTGRLFIATLK